MSSDAAARGNPGKAARQHLELLRMSGVREVFLSPELLTALREQPDQAAKPAPAPSPRTTPQPDRRSAPQGDTLESLARDSAARREREAVSQPPARPGNAGEILQQRQREIQSCTRCGLCQERNTVVYGEGSPTARLMVIGEGPGGEEDRSGRPFVGPAGQLLTRMLAAIKIDRRDAYIGNIVKCRPPGNRDPHPEEVRECLPYLKEQIQLIRPGIILLLGRVAARTLLGVDQPLKAYRQRVHTFENMPVYVTYHPAALLRTPAWKRDAWVDLQKLQKHYDNL